MEIYHPAPPSATERANVSTVCRHLALVAVDGATDEVALTLNSAFRFHVDQLDTDRAGYLALIGANHAAHPGRPPLDVISAHGTGRFVIAQLEPHCIAYFRMCEDETIGEIWMTVDWRVWQQWLQIVSN